MKEMTRKFVKETRATKAVSGAGVRLLAVVFTTMIVMAMAGCGGGGPSFTGPDQTDPKKFAEYILAQLFEKQNPAVFWEYGDYNTKKKYEDEIKEIDAASKAGWAVKTTHKEKWMELYGKANNDFGKVEKYGVINITAARDDRTKKELAAVNIFIKRERVDMHDRKYACNKSDTEEACMMKANRARFVLVKEQDGKYYVLRGTVAGRSIY